MERRGASARRPALPYILWTPVGVGRQGQHNVMESGHGARNFGSILDRYENAAVWDASADRPVSDGERGDKRNELSLVVVGRF